MSTNPSWISRLVSLVKPYIGTIIFTFSILSASVTYVLVQGTTARSIDHHETRLADVEKRVDRLIAIDAGIATLLERTEHISNALSIVQAAQVEQSTRLLTVEARMEAQSRNVERFWATTWPEMVRRLDRLETLTIAPKHGGSNP